MFKNNKIFILGLGRSGFQAAKYLAQRGNQIVLNDGGDESKHSAESIKELKSLGVKLIFGGHPDEIFDDSFDYLIKNPGVPIDHKYVLKAHDLGIEVINEMEMSYRLLPKSVKIIAITGTNGKTTTTTLIYEVMKRAFKDRVFLAGNIGVPFCSLLNEIKDDSIIVTEVSCQQLENLTEFHPNVAIMTNLSVAHVDFLKTYENYKRVKTKLFRNQTCDDVAILNNENEEVLEQTKNIQASKKYFSSLNKINGCYFLDDSIYYYGEKIINKSDILIVGIHNIENIMAMIMAVKEFGVSNDVICDVLTKFRGVEHRLEFVDDVNGRKFYNDTEATNIKCTQIALNSFETPTIIILGGLDRGQDFNDLLPYLKHVKAIIGIGQCRERVKVFGDSNNIPTYIFEHLSDGFDKCYEISSEGDTILLSPASASWDQYKECEIRGAEFKNKVYALSSKK